MVKIKAVRLPWKFTKRSSNQPVNRWQARGGESQVLYQIMKHLDYAQFTLYCKAYGPDSIDVYTHVVKTLKAAKAIAVVLEEERLALFREYKHTMDGV